MKKVLIISYFFPPCNLPASNRAYGWAKHLSEYGYYPIIITRNWERHISIPSDIHSSSGKEIIHQKFENHEVYYLPFKAGIKDKIYKALAHSIFSYVSKFFTFIELILQNYTNAIISYSNLYKFSKKYLKENPDVQFLVVTANPFTLFKFGYQLNKKFKIQWLADYRDDWNTSELLENRSFAYRLVSKVEKISEKKWVGTAEYISSVSDHYCKKISAFVNKKGFIINNGFFEEETIDYINLPLFDDFTITFNGTLYQSQPIEIFIEAFKKLIKERNSDIKIRLNFPGLAYNKIQENRVMGLLKGYEKYISVTSRISKKNILEIQARSHLLLMVAHENIIGVPSSKLYEYIALQKPVLLCPSDKDIIEQTLTDVKLGLFAANVDEAFTILKSAYYSYLNKFPIIADYNKDEIDKYSRRLITKQISLILDKFSEKVLRKKVMILAYDFPPYISVGGLRPYSWYKYMNEFGLYPIVVTRQWGNKYGNYLDYISASLSNITEIEETEQGKIIKATYHPNLSNRLLIKYGESKFKVIRRIITAYFEIGQFLFFLGSKSSIYIVAKEYLKFNKIDIIIATGDPFVLFRYATKLGEKYNIPWIADYRDPWSQDKYRSQNSLIKKLNVFFEKKYSSKAIAITTVSSFFKNKIENLISNKPFFILPNGYNPDAVDKAKEIVQANKKLSIAFVGSIYKWHPLGSFLRVCNDFVQRKKVTDFQINFYGVNAEKEIREMIQFSYRSLIHIVCIYPPMSNELLLQKLAAENVFLLFNDYSNSGTKIYDYLALKRKIILCYGDDKEANELKKKYYNLEERGSDNKHLQEDIINETHSGIIVKDSSYLPGLLDELYSEFKTNGSITCNSVNPQQFSRKIQVQKLVDFIRGLLGEKEIKYQQCVRCVMDTSDPEITFDERGYCNHCNDYFEKTSKRAYQGKSSDKKLAQLIENIKKSGKGNNYDCVIGVSGGVDSIYTAYLAKKLGLRPLAVHMDNGWNSELAVSNIEKILKKLEIDLYTLVLDWEEFRDLQLAFLKASVPEAETPTDIAIPAALHKVAAKYHIKYVLSGGNYATEGILPKNWHYNAKDVKYLKAIHEKFGTKKLNTFPTFGFEKEMYYKIAKGVRMIYPLNYIPYNKQESMKIIEKELDWKYYGGKHHESIYTKFVQSYILPKKFGIDYRLATFSTQICAGEMTREEALTELSENPYDIVSVEEEKKYICKKLVISLDEFDEIMKLPTKSYKDYANDEKKLEFIYNVYRKINK